MTDKAKKLNQYPNNQKDDTSLSQQASSENLPNESINSGQAQLFEPGTTQSESKQSYDYDKSSLSRDYDGPEDHLINDKDDIKVGR